MFTDLKPYPDYKTSGLPWMGSVPDQWRLKRTKFLFREKDHRAGGEGRVLLSLTRARGLLPQTETSKRIASVEDLSNYRVCQPGDLVMNRMQAWSGMFAVSSCDGVVSPDYSVFEATVPSEVKFFEHLFKTPLLVAQFALRSKGIGSGFNRLYADDFGDVSVPVPPLSEQAAIVRYLDHVDRRIRRYIDAKQKLVKLLEEQKQAIIHRAVTRGLDPSVRLKPSGVEWLGNIPEHWERCRLRNVVSEVTTGSRDWSSYASDTGPLFIRVANLNRGSLQLRFDDVVRLNLPNTSEVTRTRIEAGDLLVSVTAYIGSVGVAPEEFEEAYVSQHIARCQPRSGPSSQWLGYVLLSTVGQTHGQMSLYGGTKDGLSLDDVKNYPILLPPRCEQNQLVLWTERELSSLVKLGDSAKRQIDLLHEYRTRLIADVVTGKLDVRKAAARLPDEANKTEPIGEDEEWSEPVDDDIELPEVLH